MDDNSMKIDKDNIPAFVVNRSFYLEVIRDDGHSDSIIGRWVDEKPPEYVDSVTIGSILIYSYTNNGNVSFIRYSLSGRSVSVPNILIDELGELVDKGILEIL